MKCLIIAAGKGNRLKPRYASKPLAPVLGIPLIERVIRAAANAGVKDFYVVLGHQRAQVSQFLDELAKQSGITVHPIYNSEWDKAGNGLSVLKAKGHLKGNFLLMMGDHLVDATLLKGLLQNQLSDGNIILAVDRNVQNTLIDRKDATKVRIREGKVEGIGKDLRTFDGFDTGVFLCSPAIFRGISESISRHGDSSLCGGVKCLASEGKVDIHDIGKRFWIDVDDPEALEKAEKALLGNLRSKENDGPISRTLNRPISTRISRYLARFPITPNQISFVSFFLCTLSAAFFVADGYAALLMGGVLAQFASILDGCDGEIARLKFQESAYGGWLDAVLDRYADAFLLFGLTWHAYTTEPLPATLIVGFLAIMGSFMLSYTADKYDALMRFGNRGRFRIGRDLRVFLIFLGALLNLPFWTLCLIATLMNGETIRRIYICRAEG